VIAYFTTDQKLIQDLGMANRVINGGESGGVSFC